MILKVLEMTNKKVMISSDFINSIAKEEKIDDISLRFQLSDTTRTINIDLSPFLNNSLQRKKDLKKFKDFLMNYRQSLSTKKSLYDVFNSFLIENIDCFNSQENLHNVIKSYSLSLYKKVEEKKLSSRSYLNYRWRFRTIFTECYGVSYLDFDRLFCEYNKRTGKIGNATILDNNGKEKSFSKPQFKELTKILLNLSYFLDDLIDNEQIEKHQIFFYKDIFKLDFNLKYLPSRQLKNKRSLCFILIFIALTGANVNPLIRMKRTDLMIDRENKMVSFKIICNRKNKEQIHNYPIKERQLDFFDKIIKHSEKVCPDEDILFPYVENSINESKSTYFLMANLISQYKIISKGFCGDYAGISISSRKIRSSFGDQFEDIDLRSVALFNTPSTAARHYSNGNGEENTKQLQNAMNIYTIALSNSENIQTVRDNIKNINMIKITDIESLKEENSQITSSGIFCLNSKEGLEPEKFARKLAKINLENIESINCSNILACFNCKNSILVNDFENVYLLKSFYSYLINIIYETDTSSLFSDKNAVKDAMLSIKIILDTKIDKKIIKQVDKHIEVHNIHPIWNFEG